MPKHSRIQIAWLDSISVKEGIDIQHALSPVGEYVIPTVGYVDGYCSSINTVYEFHGDYWHGNPKRFASEDINIR